PNLPIYNLEIASTNNNITNVKAANAKTANVHSASGSSSNTYLAVHGYGFFSGAAQPPTNQFLIDGGPGEVFVAWEADGSSSANIKCKGFGICFAVVYSKFQGLTAKKGIQFANSTSATVPFENHFFNSTTANTIVQAGTAASPGNFYLGNYNGSQGTV